MKDNINQWKDGDNNVSLLYLYKCVLISTKKCDAFADGEKKSKKISQILVHHWKEILKKTGTILLVEFEIGNNQIPTIWKPS